VPEGHTIHALARRIERRFGGMPVAVTSPQGRFAAEARLLDGRELVGASAAGKHLFVEFAGQDYLHVHLGLIGKFEVQPYGVPGGPPEAGGGWGRASRARAAGGGRRPVPAAQRHPRRRPARA
jgi:formamidopyrimidine-DNA glycosylase